jgi:hypothetical protein
MNSPHVRRLLYFLLFLLLLECSACTSYQSPPAARNGHAECGPVCRVAFLPFVNSSRFEQGNVIVQRILGAELTRVGGAEVASEGDVRNIYRELRIFPNQLPDIEQIKVIGSRLDVQIIVSGRITEMEEKMGDNYVNPVLGVILQVYDGKSGQSLWTTYHRKEGSDYRKIMHFGLVNTVTQLSRIMADEIIEQWFAEGMKRCAE